MNDLEQPVFVVMYLRDAVKLLSFAHHFASERDGDRGGLNGSVRDLIFGLNSSVEALADMIEEAQQRVASGG